LEEIVFRFLDLVQVRAFQGLFRVGQSPLDGHAIVLAHLIAMLFERFFRGDSHRGSFSGFGLGLSIAHEFVSALGGRLSQKPSASGGTVFQIIIGNVDEAPSTIEKGM
jgi:K+-sensing histidine kinase KdpD